MNYRPLKNYFIKLKPNEEYTMDAAPGTLLVPPLNKRVYVHWLNENGKLVSTYTITYATAVQGKIKIINGNKGEEVDILVIDY